jgi:hypothetical protein
MTARRWGRDSIRTASLRSSSEPGKRTPIVDQLIVDLAAH